MMVKMTLTRIMGLIMGTVIFQKDSHAVAPSTLAASYRLPGMD